MAFISRTRIILVASGTRAAPVPVTPSVFRLGAPGIVYPTIETAMAAVPAGQRPPASEYWQYILQWEVQSHSVPTIRGVTPVPPAPNQSRLVFDVDFWETEANRLAAQPPLRRNTFLHDFTAKQLVGSRAIIHAEIDQFLITAELTGLPADYRDVANGGSPIPTTTNAASDPVSILTRQAIIDIAQGGFGQPGEPIDLPTRWRAL